MNSFFMKRIKILREESWDVMGRQNCLHIKLAILWLYDYGSRKLQARLVVVYSAAVGASDNRTLSPRNVKILTGIYYHMECVFWLQFPVLAVSPARNRTSDYFGGVTFVANHSTQSTVLSLKLLPIV